MSPEVHKYLKIKRKIQNAVHINEMFEVLVDTCGQKKGTGLSVSLRHLPFSLKSMQKEPLSESYFHLQSTVGKKTVGSCCVHIYQLIFIVSVHAAMNL